MKLVLFLNMGGATNLQDCEVFLKNMFNDPYILGIKNRFLRKFVAWIITKARVKAMQENYKKMGGKSPLNELTQSLCDKLNLKQDEFKFDFVNLYVPPFATEILQKYTLNASDEIILFPLYPHHSYTTVTSSLEVLQNEISKQKIQAKVKTIDIFYKNELYNEMIVSHILAKKSKFDAKILIFSAHSLPQSIIDKGDLYEKHVNDHVEILKEKLKDHFDEFILAYQSKLGPVKWLEPNTSDILANLDNKALIYPISFCIDCSETIFELGMEYKHLAKCDYDLITCPNDSDEFIHFILKYLSDFN
ncbi:ferrochelatase [Campylobacter jejuni]|uniref:ferrochelatase n=1 Tax=Campylobacter jejuni TaxID=197 RepID=UPI000258152E|nr:ferrochelatase [Campylobacter jejuni]EAH8699254.1 ferrochelatase [Campylobacter jejuni]EAH9839901.1 ferrochelatase [Campylobacter jejuni]EAI0446620.1 ferrochelatase [Campylobacter jejuni]EAI5709895.1 ferrochelatase [Campylobacter jejuni]EAJ6773585.1 ferrochelatase [Campylobacter jejuni]